MVLVKVLDAQRVNCNMPLSLKGFQNTLFQMVNDKYHILDGFPYEFYKKIWTLVSPNL